MNLEVHNLPSPGCKTADERLEGVVIRKMKGGLLVQAGDEPLECPFPIIPAAASGKPRAEGWTGKKKRAAGNEQAAGEEIAVGDLVRLQRIRAGNGRILDVLPRRNQISRRAPVAMPSAYAGEQLIAANIDQVVPVFAAASPPPKWNMLDRYLVSAGAAGIPALICITKLDLASPDGDLAGVVADYIRIGYPVLLVSAQTGEGVSRMREALQGRTSVLLGKSGVGKTTLLNAVEPGLGLRVGEVSRATGKGRHTTTMQEMFLLGTGGAVIDTPGVREFGLWDIDGQDLAELFPEMLPWTGQCKFGAGCRHDQEPGCAVRRAAAAGEISLRRYWSYLRLREETGGGGR